jgi:hypothetical protein
MDSSFKELVQEVSQIDREAGIKLQHIIPVLPSFFPSRCLCCAFDWDEADWPYGTWHELFHRLSKSEHGLTKQEKVNYENNKRCDK